MNPNKSPHIESHSMHEQLVETWDALLDGISWESYVKPLPLVAPDGRKLKLWRPIPPTDTEPGVVTVSCVNGDITNTLTAKGKTRQPVIEATAPNPDTPEHLAEYAVPNMEPDELITLVARSQIDVSAL